MAARRRIAIDASAVPPQPAGAGQYTLNLIRALDSASAGDFEYVVYARRHALRFLEGLSERTEVVDIGDLRRWRRYLWEQTALPLDLRRRRVDLLHSPHHTLPYAFCPCPRVVTVHDVTFFILPQRYPLARRLFFQVATWLSVRRARAIIVPSESARDDLRVFLKPPPERVHVTDEGVGPAFRPIEDLDLCRRVRECYGLPEGYLLSLGTREPGKNRSAVFEALGQLVSEGRDLHLAVAGQAGWGAALEEETAQGLGLAGRVHFLGYVPQDDLPALYNAAGAFIFPSLHEGFGLPVLEALACGTPVVTSNVSALPEIAGDAALLVDPTSPEAIAEAVARLLDEPELALGLRQAGFERAARFTWEACAEATLEVYRNVLKQPGRRIVA